MSATGRRDAGATLLEALVVLAITAMISAVAFPNLTRGLDRMALRQAERALTADIAEARARAIRGGSPVLFNVAADGRSYGWSGSARRSTPSSVSVSLEPSVLSFSQDGGATPGQIRLTSVAGAASLTIDPVTGSVLAGRS
ncbi:MAG: pilus assembly FimT family protein [Caulobacteraceae bacterium]